MSTTLPLLLPAIFGGDGGTTLPFTLPAVFGALTPGGSTFPFALPAILGGGIVSAPNVLTPGGATLVMVGYPPVVTITAAAQPPPLDRAISVVVDDRAYSAVVDGRTVTG